jgi:hypothetical protein
MACFHIVGAQREKKWRVLNSRFEIGATSTESTGQYESSHVFPCTLVHDMVTSNIATAHTFLRSGKMRLDVRSGSAQADGGLHCMNSYEKKKW